MKEMIKRAARTFLQAAAGYITGVISGVIEMPTFGENVIACLLLSAVAAGLAALMNMPAGGNNGNN